MAAGATYEPIATTTLSTSATSYTFTSIPATYTDLRLVLNVLSTTTSGCYGIIRPNSDTGTNYSATKLVGNGTTATSGTAGVSTANPWLNGGSNKDCTNTIPGLYTIDFFSYAGSTYKTMLISGSSDLNGSGLTIRQVCLWMSTTAISSIKIDETNGDPMAAGTTATLYGIKAA